MKKMYYKSKKKLTPTPNRKTCACSREAYKKTGNIWICPLCLYLDSRNAKAAMAGVKRRRVGLQLAVEPYGWYDGGMNGKYNL